MYFVQESENIKWFEKLFKLVKLEEDKIKLPVCVDELLNVDKREKVDKLAKIFANKTNKILNKSYGRKLVLSKKIKEFKTYVNLLYSMNVNIVDSKWLYEVLIYDILLYIVNKRKLDTNQIMVAVLINDASEIMVNNISRIAKNVKNLSIITNHIEKFKKLEERLFREEGIIITVGNNKRKSLLKSNIVINYDFTSEMVNDFSINNSSVIVNILEEVFIKKKRFEGYNVNDYEIEFYDKNNFDYEKMNYYYIKDVYEANAYKHQPFNEIMKNIQKDNVRIKYLKTSRGIL